MSDRVCEREDSTVLERWNLDSRIYTRYESDVLVVERPFTDAETQWADEMAVEETRRANADTILVKARTAYTNNQAYLALVDGGTATNADHITQVPRLTRQMQEVIRWIVGGDLLDNLGSQ